MIIFGFQRKLGKFSFRKKKFVGYNPVSLACFTSFCYAVFWLTSDKNPPNDLTFNLHPDSENYN